MFYHKDRDRNGLVMQGEAGDPENVGRTELK